MPIPLKTNLKTNPLPSQAWSGLILCALLMACSPESPEQRLRATLTAMQTAVSERQPADFMQRVTADFAGNDGLDRNALHGLLRAQLLRHAAVGATTGPVEVEMKGDRATVRFSVALTGGSGGLLPDQARVYRVTSGWSEVEGDWQVYYAEWE